MLIISSWLSVVLAIFCFAMGIFSLIIFASGKNKKDQQTKTTDETITSKKEGSLTEITMALVILGLIAYIASRPKKGRKK